MSLADAKAPRRLVAALLPERGPGRIVVLASLLGSIGFGLYVTTSAIYFVNHAGLSAVQVGSALSMTGLAGILLGMPVGHLADRFGAREIAITTALAKGVPLAFFPLAGSYWQFLALVGVVGIADGGWTVANDGVVAGVVRSSERVRTMAFLRSMFNVGMTGGAACAGVALAVDTAWAYDVVFGSYALVSVLVAVLYLTLPRVEPVARDGSAAHGLRWVSDLPYLAVAQVTGGSLLGDAVLDVGLPLWVAVRTDAPRWLVGYLIALNTLLVVVLQVRVAGLASSLAGAMRSQRRAGIALVAMCILAAASSGLSASLASIVLVLSVLALTAGELWGSASRWALRFAFAPEGRQATYGAAFRLGHLGPRVGGPIAVTALTSKWGGNGWLVLAALFALTVPLGGMAIRWAARTRPPGCDRAWVDSRPRLVTR